MAYTSETRFVWDEPKNLANQRKHGVSFEEASELFVSNVEYYEVFDEDHSVTEARFVRIGPIKRGLVVVAWTERSYETIRIISAPRATKNERRIYLRYLEKQR